MKEGRVEVVVPATVDEEVEAINGDQVGERVLVVHSTQWRYLHRCSHPLSLSLCIDGMNIESWLGARGAVPPCRGE